MSYHKLNVISCLFALKYSFLRSCKGEHLEELYHAHRFRTAPFNFTVNNLCAFMYAADSMSILFDCVWTCAFAFVCMRLIFFHVSSVVWLVHVCIWSELNRSLCVFCGTAREKLQWCWQSWTVYDSGTDYAEIPPEWNTLLGHVKEIKKKRLSERERVKKRETQRLVYSYLGGRSFLFFW